jgi:hypothetical protein
MAVSTTSLSVLDSTSTAKTLATQTDPAGVQAYAVTLDRPGIATYRASIMYTLGVATPTAVVVAQGSATKTIRFTMIKVQGWSTTAGVMKWKASRRTTAGTLGSAVLTAIPTQGKNDSGTVASPTLTVSTVGTANYGTLGTLSAILDCGVVGFNLAAQINNTIPWVPVSPATASQAFVLRGTSDWITLDGGADAGGDAVPAGGIALITLEWVEDAS